MELENYMVYQGLPKDPEVICKCSNCGFEFYNGDEYYEFEGDIYCDDCFDDCIKEECKHIAE